MRISGFTLISGLILSALLAGCASRSTDLTSVFENPWPHHGQTLIVVVHPRDVGDGLYLACIAPCPGREPASIANTWVVPVDPEAFKGWDGRRAIRLKVVVNASSYAPNAIPLHFPLWLEDAAPPDAAHR